tara:strand:- start:7250 stop:10447 length:3198 start_codon:yes stop_codon:yes gene_type:complete
MSNKNYKMNNNNINNNNKVQKLKEIITRTSIEVHRHKLYDVLGSKELNLCLKQLEQQLEKVLKLENIIKNNISKKKFMEYYNEIKNSLYLTIKSFGTSRIEDLIEICFGEKYILNLKNKTKWEVLKKYVKPIGFKSMSMRENKVDKNKPISKNRIVEDFMISDRGKTLDCYDLSRTSTNFQTKVFGIKIAFQNNEEKKTLIVCGLVETVVIQCLNSEYINNKYRNIYLKKPKEPDFNRGEFDNFLNILSLKDYLIYEHDEIFNRYIGYLNQLELFKKKTISSIVKDFLSGSLFQQRKILMQLLINDNNSEYQYLAYLLYDLLSNETNNNIDSYEQTLLFDSLPWYSKKFFGNAMDKTMSYTKTLTNFDTNKIPLEQQICLLKADDNVKEKAMIKLKEIKAKSEDSGSKARQYLDGLLKIPFGIYKSEEILKILTEMNICFKNILQEKIEDIEVKEKYSLVELRSYINYLKDDYTKKVEEKNKEKIKKIYVTGKRKDLINNINICNNIIKKNKIKKKLKYSGKKNSEMVSIILNFIENINNKNIILDLIKEKPNNNIFDISKIEKVIKTMEEKTEKLEKDMVKIKDCLNESVHGHENAKRQVERIIGQWISGKQTGYCFGFEGAPGVGKTSLAKNGLSKCLIDDNGKERPFAFIALGGSCNGSTIAGHNYTYVGSTWGKIVDILIEKKCMNPIIFIDELDKVSKTEHGKEIIGILTHLTDRTQNDKFEDKYFSGIGLDLSKVLFIFSYNDVSAIDKILLDRIHRIKFDSLSVKDKITISNKYLLPEIYENMGMKNIMKLKDNVLKYIIENYTKEAGVRKLKEILFEIISEINLNLLEKDDNYKLPIYVTIDELKNKYLKDRITVNYISIQKKSEVGIINGLWANAIGMGGIIQIECKYFPTGTFLDLKLTGMQGDVMKESMNVAKTLAWNLCKSDKQKEIVKQIEKTKMQGIHIHCPEGSVPKDGPSAGTAITIAIYSLLTNSKIPNNIAITGEMNLSGNVTKIGGLDLKILGGMRGGVTHFLFPKENEADYNKLIEKYDENFFKNIKFTMVESIKEVIEIIFSKG